jgi:hypothetical protein
LERPAARLGDEMSTGEQKDADARALTLEERVKLLEGELANLRRTANRRNWAIEALLIAILLMGATAWILWRG